MNKSNPRFTAQSPYQRPVSGGAVGQDMYDLFQGNSAMENAIRFPSRATPSEQMSGRYSAPGQSKSRYGYPYFQRPPQYPDQHRYFESADTAYRCQFDDVTPSRPGPYKQLQATAGTSLPKRYGQQVRFTLPTEGKVKQRNEVSPSTSAVTEPPKPYKRWQENSKPLRVLTGSIDKIIKWHNITECSPVHFEVIATLVAVRPGASRCEQTLLLRDEATPALQCVFYTIDRPLPLLEKGQLVRCVGEMQTKNKLRAYSVRAASVAEKSGLQRLSFASQRAVAALQLAVREP